LDYFSTVPIILLSILCKSFGCWRLHLLCHHFLLHFCILAG